MTDTRYFDIKSDGIHFFAVINLPGAKSPIAALIIKVSAKRFDTGAKSTITCTKSIGIAAKSSKLVQKAPVPELKAANWS